MNNHYVLAYKNINGTHPSIVKIPKNSTGKQGSTGETGPTGSTGYTGNPGAAGSAGGEVGYLNYNVSGSLAGYQQLSSIAVSGDSTQYSTTTTVNANNVLVSQFITNNGKPGIIQLPAGINTVNIYADLVGGGTGSVTLYAKILKIDTSDVVTVLLTTSNSEPITEFTSFIKLNGVLTSAVTLLTTDRLGVAIYANNNTGTRNIITYYQGSSYSYVTTTLYAPVGPTGPTGPTGQTGSTGSTGPNLWTQSGSNISYTSGNTTVKNIVVNYNNPVNSITSSTTLSINLGSLSSNIYTLSISDNVTGITFSNPVNGGQYVIYINNSSTTLNYSISNTLTGSTNKTNYFTPVIITTSGYGILTVTYYEGIYYISGSAYS